MVTMYFFMTCDFFLDYLTLEDETNRLSQHVSNKTTNLCRVKSPKAKIIVTHC
jgi:hypothetical protein